MITAATERWSATLGGVKLQVLDTSPNSIKNRQAQPQKRHTEGEGS